MTTIEPPDPVLEAEADLVIRQMLNEDRPEFELAELRQMLANPHAILDLWRHWGGA